MKFSEAARGRKPRVGIRGVRPAVGVAVIAIAGTTFGCAEVLPPKELVDARAAYDHAQAGLAAKLAPAQLDTAKKSLQAAERSFRDTEDSPETKALAYIADRRARLAEAMGDIAQADADKTAAENELKERQSQELDKARSAVTDANRRAATAAEKAEAERKAREAAEAARLEAEKARKEAERVAAQALAALKELQVKEEQRGVVITLGGEVLFTSGKSDLLPLAKDKLNEVYKVLKEQKHPKLRIEGHTDSVGSPEENRKLSLARAESVKSQLVGQGYPSDRITTAGLGPDRPVADNGSAEGRANNRRVEIIVNPK